MARLSYLLVAGSPFDAGFALGRFGAPSVHAHLVRSDAWHTVMRWRGSEKINAMTTLVRQQFPGIWAELQGLAKGLQLPLEDVFLWNCRGDLWAMAPDGCTTVQLPGDSERWIAHNEDGDPGFAGHCAIAECAIEGSATFAAFVYPGSLAGHTFAVTDLGLAMTVNNLRVRHVGVGIPRMVLTRALLNTDSLTAAVALLERQPRAGGFHLTLAHQCSADLLSVEFSSLGYSVQTVTTPSLHANHATHPAMKDFPQIITGSSGHRQVRGDVLLKRCRESGTPIEPLAILGDTDHPRFPIHRSAVDDEDDENTLATAHIQVGTSQIAWEVFEHPLAPVFRMVGGRIREIAPVASARRR